MPSLFVVIVGVGRAVGSSNSSSSAQSGRLRMMSVIGTILDWCYPLGYLGHGRFLFNRMAVLWLMIKSLRENGRVFGLVP